MSTAVKTVSWFFADFKDTFRGFLVMLSSQIMTDKAWFYFFRCVIQRFHHPGYKSQGPMSLPTVCFLCFIESMNLPMDQTVLRRLLPTKD